MWVKPAAVVRERERGVETASEVLVNVSTVAGKRCTVSQQLLESGVSTVSQQLLERGVSTG